MVEDLNLNFGEKVVENKPFPKKILIICIAAFLVVLTGILLFVFAFPHKTNVDFDFYLNNSKVNEDLTVLFSYDDKNFEVKTVKDKLTVSLPKNKDVSLEVLTIGYQYKDDLFIDNTKYDIKINKAINIAELEGEQEIVDFYIYKYPNTNQLYNDTVVLDLSCSNSSKKELFALNGKKSYTKPDDCGSLSVKLVSNEFKPINQTCNVGLCKIILYDSVETPITVKMEDYRNNILVHTVKNRRSILEDVNVSIYQDNVLVVDGLTDEKGFAYFTNLLVGDYKIIGNYKIGSRNYQAIKNIKLENTGKDLNVNLEFKISSGSSGSSSSTVVEKNTYNIFVVTDNDYDVNFKYLISQGQVIVAEDVAVTPFTTVDLEEGVYFITIIPEVNDDFNKNFNPIYLKEINLDSDKNIILKKLDLNSNVFLSIPTYLDVDKDNKLKTLQYGVNLEIYDSDTNVLLYDYINKDNEVHGFVLDKSKEYIIKAEKNDYNKLDKYKFESCDIINTNGVCYDSLSIYLEKKYLDFLNLNVYRENKPISDFNIFISNVDDIFGAKIGLVDGVLDYNLNYGVDYYFKVETNIFGTKLTYFSAPVTFRKGESVLNIYLDYDVNNFYILPHNFYLDNKLTIPNKDNNLDLHQNYYLPVNIYHENYLKNYNFGDYFKPNIFKYFVESSKIIFENFYYNTLDDDKVIYNYPNNNSKEIIIKQNIFKINPEELGLGYIELKKSEDNLSYNKIINFNIYNVLDNLNIVDSDITFKNLDISIMKSELSRGVSADFVLNNYFEKNNLWPTNYFLVDLNSNLNSKIINLQFYKNNAFYNCDIKNKSFRPFFKQTSVLNSFTNVLFNLVIDNLKPNIIINDNNLKIELDSNDDFWYSQNLPLEFNSYLDLELSCSKEAVFPESQISEGILPKNDSVKIELDNSSFEEIVEVNTHIQDDDYVEKNLDLENNLTIMPDSEISSQLKNNGNLEEISNNLIEKTNVLNTLRNVKEMQTMSSNIQNMSSNFEFEDVILFEDNKEILNISIPITFYLTNFERELEASCYDLLINKSSFKNIYNLPIIPISKTDDVSIINLCDDRGLPVIYLNYEKLSDFNNIFEDKDYGDYILSLNIGVFEIKYLFYLLPEELDFNLLNDVTVYNSGKINVDYSNNNVDCSVNYCSASQFYNYTLNKDYKDKSVYLMDDNYPFFENLNINFTKPGIYTLLNNTYEYYFENNSDHIFYYIPKNNSKNLFINIFDIAGLGSCSVLSAVNKYSKNDFIPECGNNYITLKMVPGLSSTNVLDAILEDKNIYINMYSGIFVAICDDSNYDKCYKDNANYYAVHVRDIYNANDLFVIEENKIKPKYSLDKFNDILLYSISSCNEINCNYEIESLQDVIDYYNKGLVYLINNNNNYGYYWNLESIIKPI